VKRFSANDNFQHHLIQRTQQVWQPRLGRDLSREDARQIAANVASFFSVLAKWSAEMSTPANDVGTPTVSDLTEAQHDR
jgi:hypothetical protein